MSVLETRAEIAKLARLYQVETEALDFLLPLRAEDIRKLREAIQDRLFSDDDALFKRLASASMLLPLGLLAMMAEKIFGPVLAARVAGAMNTKRAVALSERLSIAYLADISLELDPRRAHDIIRNIPPQLIRKVTAELLKRREYITLGRFVGYLTDAAIREALKAFTEAEDLLQTGFFIEDKTQLNKLIRIVPEDMLQQTISAAQDPQRGLWPEALALMGYVDDELKRRLGELTIAQGQEALSRIVRITSEQQLWDTLLPVVACLSEESHQKLVDIPELSDHDIMAGIARAANDNHLWPAFLPLVGLMNAAQRKTAAEVAGILGTDALQQVLQAVQQSNAWQAILQLASEMNEAQLTQLAETASTLPEEAIAELVDTAKIFGAELWEPLLDIVAKVPPDTRLQYANLIAKHAADEPELVEKLAPLVQARGLDELLGIARKAAGQ